MCIPSLNTTFNIFIGSGSTSVHYQWEVWHLITIWEVWQHISITVHVHYWWEGGLAAYQQISTLLVGGVAAYQQISTLLVGVVAAYQYNIGGSVRYLQCMPLQ